MAGIHDGRHHYGPVPGSPTLTNPDMILPDYDAPPSPDGRSQSPLMSWADPNLDQLDFQLPPQAGGYGGYMGGGGGGGKSSVLPPTTTPIIYGNGTMLSDIGEVTEVESTVGGPALADRRTSSRYSNYTETETFGPSPATTNAAVMSKVLARRTAKMQQLQNGNNPHTRDRDSRDRRSSIDSNSTITSIPDARDQRPAPFADFDDAVSVDDSSFQGDDEESMASEYVEGTVPATRSYEQHKGLAGVNGGTQDGGDGNHSAAFISNRAEMILATAKRRLTAMEGNLSRARSSLGHSEGSTPSPQLVTSPNAPSLRISTSTSAPHVSGHARIKSEDGPMGTPKQQSPYGAGITRSASALGAAGGYRQPPTKLKRDDLSSPTGRLSQGISSFPLDTTLESLGEDDTWSNADSMRSGFLSPTGSIYGGDKGLTRSASAAQMRGIQDQMQGLRGKISTLKQQAKADSLKRRSLQSLRTPSPFTHARWDQGLMEPNEIRAGNSRETTPPLPTPDTIKTDGKVDGHGNEAPVTAEAVVANAGTQEDEKTVSSDRRPMSGYSSSSRKTPVQQEGLTPDASHVPQNLEKQQEQDQQLRKQDEAVDINDDDDDDLRTEDGDAYEDAYGPSEYDENDKDDVADDASDWASESGESLYHDTEQFSTSHEDREDAFDYEHFFLHSAMGNMSRHRGEEESSESDFSDASVETTRGPVPVVTPTATLSRAGTAASSRNMSRARRHSGDSNASDETFATANDGRPSRMSVRDSRRGSPVGTAYEELSPLREVRSEDGATSSRLSANDDEERSGLPPPRLQLHRSQYSATSSLLNRPMSASAAHQAGRLHRPSVSSFESTGTTRSFPLVNKSKAAAAAAALGGGGIVASSSSTTAVGGVLTPGGSPSSSSDDGANAPEPALLPKTAMQGLAREDQIAVERLVASLGRVVLGLGDGESSRGGAEYRLLRRRIDAARRMLEGQGDVASP